MPCHGSGTCFEAFNVAGDLLCKEAKFGRIERPRLTPQQPAPAAPAALTPAGRTSAPFMMQYSKVSTSFVTVAHTECIMDALESGCSHFEIVLPLLWLLLLISKQVNVVVGTCVSIYCNVEDKT